MQRWFSSPWSASLLTALGVAAAIPAEYLLRSRFGVQAPATPFFLAVLLCAWFGGLYSGLLATVLSVLGLYFLVEPPVWVALNAIGDFSRTALFLLFGTLVSVMLESALRSHREARRQAAFLDQAQDALFAWQPSGAITYWNKATQRLYGYTATEALGRPVHDLLATRFPEPFADIHSALEQRGSWQGELMHSTKDGRELTVESRMSLLREPHQPPIVVEAVRDVTDRKLAEAQLAQAHRERQDADRRKDEFLAILAHELRGPMAPLRNGLHIVERIAAGDPKLAHTVEMMDRQMRQLVRLVEDLLDISRITRGKLDLRREPLSLSAAVHSGVEACRPLVEDKGHDLQLEIAAPELSVEGDFARLSQVFSNLLSNAVKYSDRGSRIRIGIGHDADFGIVTIQDSGIGIPAEALEQVFEMFAQVEAHKQYMGGGLGIGLALVRKLVSMHGGTVAAASGGVGQGSTFTVRLPLLAAPGGLARQPGSQVETPAARRRVLVADDNVDAAHSLATLLELNGHEVRTARDGKMAVEQAESFRPDVIFMDVGMPVLSGLDATRQIRSFSWGRHVTIVALTGWGQEIDRQRSREAGVDHHVVKPVDRAMLTTLLRRA